MKKIILFPLALCACFLCGCERNSNADKARIDALAQKMDVVLQNQSLICSNQNAIFKQMEFIETQVVMLPTVQQMNSAVFFNATNAVGYLESRVLLAQVDIENYIKTTSTINFTNMAGLQLELLKSGGEANREMARDIFLLNPKVDDMQRDINKIKTHLGLF